MAAHQAPPSLGFCRQERWSGLPFPSPMSESEKWKWSRSVVPDSATPWTAAYQASPSIGFSRQEYWSGLPLPSLYGFNYLLVITECLPSLPIFLTGFRRVALSGYPNSISSSLHSHIYWNYYLFLKNEHYVALILTKSSLLGEAAGHGPDVLTHPWICQTSRPNYPLILSHFCCYLCRQLVCPRLR